MLAKVTSKNQLTLPKAITATVGEAEPPPLVPKCRDKHDLPFLHLATAGKAHVLVSADADLPALAGGAKSAIRFDIVAPVHFMRKVGLITV